jgi:CheY-like chemotaxis protein
LILRIRLHPQNVVTSADSKSSRMQPFTDITVPMPIMSGLEATNQIVKNQSDAKVLMVLLATQVAHN